MSRETAIKNGQLIDLWEPGTESERICRSYFRFPMALSRNVADIVRDAINQSSPDLSLDLLVLAFCLSAKHSMEVSDPSVKEFTFPVVLPSFLGPVEQVFKFKVQRDSVTDQPFITVQDPFEKSFW